MTKQEFAMILAVVHSAYPNEKITTDKLASATYWEHLKNEDAGYIMQELQSHIRKSKFPPTIAELLNEYDNQGLRKRKYIWKDYTALITGTREFSDEERKLIAAGRSLPPSSNSLADKKLTN